MPPCLNGLRHVILNVLVAAWREDIFGFFEVWNANRWQRKYSININYYNKYIWTIRYKKFCHYYKEISHYLTAKRGPLNAPVSEQVTPCHSKCSHGCIERIFLDFSRPGSQN